MESTTRPICQSLRRVVLLSVCAITLTASLAQASHFRFGHTTWRRVGDRVVEFISLQAWRSDRVTPSELMIDAGDGSLPLFGPVETLLTGVDSFGESFTLVRFRALHQYALADSTIPFLAVQASCCRVGNLVNAGFAPIRLETSVDLRGGNLGSPVSSISPLIQMAANHLNTIPLGVTDPDGDPITCRFAAPSESSIPANPAGLAISPGCVLSWDTTLDTTGIVVGQKYAVQLMVEENHVGNIAKSALDFIIEIIQGEPPVCTSALAGQALEVPAGETFAATFSGTDPNTDEPLTILNLGTLPTGAVLSPAIRKAGTQSFEATFSWTPSVADIGSVFAISIVFEDPFGFRSVPCAFTITVTENRLECFSVQELEIQHFRDLGRATLIHNPGFGLGTGRLGNGRTNPRDSEKTRDKLKLEGTLRAVTLFDPRLQDIEFTFTDQVDDDSHTFRIPAGSFVLEEDWFRFKTADGVVPDLVARFRAVEGCDFRFEVRDGEDLGDLTGPFINVQLKASESGMADMTVETTLDPEHGELEFEAEDDDLSHCCKNSDSDRDFGLNDLGLDPVGSLGGGTAFVRTHVLDSASEVKIYYRTTLPNAEVRIGIYNVLGARIRVIKDKPHTSKGSVTWDRRDEMGRRVPRGIYLIQVRAGTTKSSGKLVLVHD